MSVGYEAPHRVCAACGVKTYDMDSSDGDPCGCGCGCGCGGRFGMRWFTRDLPSGSIAPRAAAETGDEARDG